MSEPSVAAAPDGPGKPEKKGKKKKWFFFTLVAAAIVGGGVYLFRNIDQEPPHGFDR